MADSSQQHVRRRHNDQINQLLDSERPRFEEEGSADEHSTEYQDRIDGKTRRRKGRKGGKKSGQMPRELADAMGRANFHYVERQFHLAVPLLIEIIKKSANIHPPPSDPYHTLGLIYDELGETQTAFDFFYIAAQLVKKDTELWKRLGRMAYELGDFEKAILCFNRVLRSDPNDEDTLWDRSYVFLYSQDYAKACAGFGQLFQKRRDDPNVIREYAKALHMTKKTSQAIQVLTGNVNVANDLHAVNILLEMYIQQEHFQEAVNYMTKFVLTPGDGENRQLPIDIHVNLGLCYEKLGEHEKADKHFKYLTDLGDEATYEYRDSFLLVADAFLEQRTKELPVRPECAEPLLTRLLQHFAEDSPVPQVWWRLARCYKFTYAKTNDRPALEQSVKLCNQLLEQDAGVVPDGLITEARLLLADNYQALGETDKAMEVVNSAAAAQPKLTERTLNSLRILVRRARILLGKADTASVIEFVELMYPEMLEALNYLKRMNPREGGKSKRIVYPENPRRRRKRGSRNNSANPAKKARTTGPVATVASATGTGKDKAAAAGTATDAAEASDNDEDLFMREQDDESDEVMSEPEEEAPKPEPDVNLPKGETLTILAFCSRKEFFELLEAVSLKLSDLERYDESLEIFDSFTSVIKWSPAEEHRAHQLLAAAAFNCQRYEVAFVMVKKVLSVSPTSIPGWGLLARIMNLSENPDHMYSAHRFAIRQLQKHEKALPIQLTVAHSSVLTTSHALALGLYFQALEALEGDAPLVLMCIGLTYLNLVMKKGTVDRHYSHLQSFVFIEKYKELLDRELAEMIRSQQSKRDLDRVVATALRKASPHHPEASYNLARAFQELKLDHLAIPHYEQVLLVDDVLTDQFKEIGICLPNLKMCTAYNLSLIYKEKGEEDVARRYIAQYIELR